MSAGWQNPTFWTDERIELCKKLWTEGQSATQIGEAIGTSRNAVIGKLHREGLKRQGGRVAGSRSYNKQKIKQMVRHEKIKRVRSAAGGRALKVIETITSDPFEMSATEPVKPTKLLDLAAGQCRWPCSGEGVDTIFCGGEAIKDLPYCGGHCRLAYRMPRHVTSEEFEIEARRRREAYKAKAA